MDQSCEGYRKDLFKELPFCDAILLYPSPKPLCPSREPLRVLQRKPHRVLHVCESLWILAHYHHPRRHHRLLLSKEFFFGEMVLEMVDCFLQSHRLQYQMEVDGLHDGEVVLLCGILLELDGNLWYHVQVHQHRNHVQMQRLDEEGKLAHEFLDAIEALISLLRCRHECNLVTSSSLLPGLFVSVPHLAFPSSFCSSLFWVYPRSDHWHSSHQRRFHCSRDN